MIGLSVALSSSIVIVNITLSRRRTTDRPTEEALIGWAVMQDIVGVALAAILLSVMDPGGRSLGEAALGLVGFGVVTIVAARLLLPRVLRGLRDEHDLFLITSVGSGLALAGVGAAVFGVPLALAAFVGGLAVTESHEANEARRRLRPFRDVFAVLFFVAIGQRVVDPSQLGAAAPWIVLLLGLVVVAKVLARGCSRRSSASMSGRSSSRSASVRSASSASCWCPSRSRRARSTTCCSSRSSPPSP